MKANKFFVCLWLLLSFPAFAGGMIRDAEIEHGLRAMAQPLLISAGIPPEDVRLFIVNDSSVNAFVAGGMNIFIHSGLIKKTENAGMLIGVLAHEIGHIEGAHLSQLSGHLRNATIGSIIGAVIGAATIAGGGGGAGAGIIVGSQNMAERSLLANIRIHEQSADHAALKYMDDNGFSADGMRQMFALLQQNERGRRPDPYLRSHPLSSERVRTVKHHVEQSTIPAGTIPPHFKAMHARMRAKLIAFTEPPAFTRTTYPSSDTSVAARYARAIADFRENNWQQAANAIQALQKVYPNDPYFADTLGQIFFEHGKLQEAKNAYAKAYALSSNSAIIMTDYARTLLALNQPALLSQAVALLQRAGEVDSTNTNTWRQLAIAYGKQGNSGASYLALAQEAASTGDYESVKQHLARATAQLPENSSQALAAADLLQEADNELKRREEERSLF